MPSQGPTGGVPLQLAAPFCQDLAGKIFQIRNQQRARSLEVTGDVPLERLFVPRDFGSDDVRLISLAQQLIDRDRLGLALHRHQVEAAKRELPARAVMNVGAEHRVIFNRVRSIPERHHRVADELVDCSVLGVHRGRHHLEVEPQPLRDPVGRFCFRARREALDVREEDGHLAQRSAQGRLAVFLEQLSHQRQRYVLSHRPHRDLRLLEAEQRLANFCERRAHD